MSHMFGSDYDELIDRARLGSAYDNQLSDIAEERLEIPNEKRGKGEKPVMLVTELEADAYRERPPRPICKFDEIQWAEPKQLQDETTVGIKFCWPLAFEAQMWEQARCRECNQLARWIGIASPFGDGERYFMAADAWCYWCFPRENFTAEELQLARHAEWARKQTVDEILGIIRHASSLTDNKTVEWTLSDLADQVREATKSQETKLGERAAWECFCGSAAG